MDHSFSHICMNYNKIKRDNLSKKITCITATRPQKKVIDRRRCVTLRDSRERIFWWRMEPRHLFGLGDECWGWQQPWRWRTRPGRWRLHSTNLRNGCQLKPFTYCKATDFHLKMKHSLSCLLTKIYKSAKLYRIVTRSSGPSSVASPFKETVPIWFLPLVSSDGLEN